MTCKNKNAILAVIQQCMPEKLKERTVRPETGRGRKDRPRKKKWNGDSASVINRLLSSLTFQPLHERVGLVIQGKYVQNYLQPLSRRHCASKT